MVAIAFPSGTRTCRPGALGPRSAGPARPGAAVYRRRRGFALALLVTLLVATFFAGRVVLGGLGGGPLTAADPPGPGVMQPAAVRLHVVQPGDTLWSIARDASGGADPRPIVDRLMAERHGRALQVGERIALP